MNKPKLSEFLKHETKKHSLIKFVGLVIIVICYLIYMSAKLGTENGIFVTGLTWSFFVFCTPIADAGFILAFPVRLLSGIRMVYTQIFSFVLAFILSLIAFFNAPEIFDSTIILKLYHQILSQPYPFWAIIILSISGTVLSIFFGDELVDVSSHNERVKYHKHINKLQIISFVFLFGITLVLYDFLLKKLGIDIPI